MRADEVLALVGGFSGGVRQAEPGDRLRERGATGSDVLVIAEGEVELRLPGIPPVVLDRCGPGAVIGIEQALTGQPSACEAVARTGARLILLTQESLLGLIREHEDFCQYVLLQTARGLQASQSAAGSLNSRTNLLEAHIARQADQEYGDLLGQSRATEQLRAEITQRAQSGGPLLLVGEAGVGKELVAWHLHLWGPRREEPFLTLQARDWQADEWQRMLATGAGGTILIKDIDALTSEAVQAVGDASARAGLDRPRIIATQIERPGEASKLPPPWDSVPPLRVPPLRERKADIPELARSFLRELNAAYGATDEPISHEAMRQLVAYPYLAANLAELRGVITHAAHLAQGGRIRPEHLRMGGRNKRPGRPVVGIALGGGVVRGMAHIGVLQVLQEERIPVDIVAGTSVGSLVGAVYAGGYPLEELEKLAPTLSWPRLVGPVWPKDGLLSNLKLGKFVEGLVGPRRIEDLSIPYAAVAVDRITGDEVIMRSGPVSSAVRASTAIPGLFQPLEAADRQLIDGGLVNNVPASVVRSMGADVVIAVDVRDYNYFQPDKGGLALSFLRGYDIMIHRAAQSELEWADVPIFATKPGVNPYGFKAAKELIEAGREQARLAVPAIRAALAQAEARVS